jgi:AcrR family transcriptional regulator
MSDAVERSGRVEHRAAVSNHLEAVALELFARDGYPNICVDDIAAAAGVSSRTFHRYFASKPDVLLQHWEVMDQRTIERLRPLSGVRAPIRAIRDIYIALTEEATDLASFRVWHQAIATAPDVLARGSGESRRRMRRVMRGIFAEWWGVDPDRDVRPDAMSAAVLGVNAVAVERYVESNGEDDLVALFVVAFDFLDRGLTSAARDAVTSSRVKESRSGG